MDKFKQAPNSSKSSDVPATNATSQDDRAKQLQEAWQRSSDKQKNAESDRQVKQADAKSNDPGNAFSSSAKNLYPNQIEAGHKAIGRESKYSGKSVDPIGKMQQVPSVPRAKRGGTSSIDHDFAAAKQRCDFLTGDAKDKCIREARARFGQL